MELNDYPSNSHKAKEEAKQEKEEKPFVKSNDIQVRQESAGKKILKTFITEDFSDIKDSIVYEYIVPGIKECIRSVVDMMLGGDGYSSRSRRDSDRNRSRASYDAYYSDRRRDSERRRRDEDDRRRLSYDDFLYKTRPKAECVRNDLIKAMDRYEVVSVSDFYDILKENGMYVDDRDRAYTDNTYGWYDLGPCHIDPVRGGYILNLPKPVPLD